MVIAPILLAIAAPVISGQGPQHRAVAPGDVMSSFLATTQSQDADAASALLESDAAITGTDGRVSRGKIAVAQFIAQWSGWEASPLSVNENEVVWTESLSNWPTQGGPVSAQMELVVPRYAYVQVMCAVVSDGKIHALLTLTADRERSCKAAEPFRVPNYAMLVVVLVVTWGSRLAHRPPTQASRGKQLIQALGSWRASTPTYQYEIRSG
jgi:hypothetical protein